MFICKDIIQCDRKGINPKQCCLHCKRYDTCRNACPCRQGVKCSLMEEV